MEGRKSIFLPCKIPSLYDIFGVYYHHVVFTLNISGGATLLNAAVIICANVRRINKEQLAPGSPTRQYVKNLEVMSWQRMRILQNQVNELTTELGIQLNWSSTG